MSIFRKLVPEVRLRRPYPQSQDRAWEFAHMVLDRLDVRQGAERICLALDELLLEEFALDRAVLFWKAAGQKSLKKVPFHLDLDIDTLDAEDNLAAAQRKPSGSMSLAGAECEYVYLQTSSGLEILFFYNASTEINAAQLLYALRVWSLRWEKVISEKDIQRTGLQLSKIRTISEELGKTQELKPLLSRILKMTISLVDAERGFIMLVNEKTGNLKVEIVHGLPNQAAEKLVNEGKVPMAEIPPGQGIQGRVLQSRDPVLVEQITDFRSMGLDKDVHSIICVPLVMNNEAFGVIYVTNKKDNIRFSTQDLDLVGILAASVAAAVDQERLYHKTITDHLTGIHTRRFMDQRLEQEVKRTLRYRTVASLIAIDADHFKKVNDTYGHAAGDIVLKTIATVINRCIRLGVDIPARIGGEEFVVLLPETPVQGAKVVAERIRKQMEATTIDVAGANIQITLSLGVATCPDHGDNSEALMVKADRALYHAKDTGRNKVVLFSEVNSAE